ncbi:hypothetical protein DRN97_10185 [Methanosarcinales archaeon]|nr:MAG: hypothetical protein DRN97_10185 [Methanosarcinales archaeon]
MSQVAILEGNIGNGRTSSYAIYEHHSDARAWSVTVGEPAKAIFDYFSPRSGPFKPGELKSIVYNRVKNIGSLEGRIYGKFEQLDSAGNVIKTICSVSDTFAGGECKGIDYAEHLSTCNFENIPACDDSSACAIYLPTTPGTYYYGIKTWAEGESEPPYPSPTAALAGAEVLPAAGEEGMGLAIPITVASGLTLVGLGILQARSRRF